MSVNKFNFDNMKKRVLSHTNHGNTIDTAKKLQKLDNEAILSEALNALSDKDNYNSSLDKNNPDYKGINHAYHKVNSLIVDNELHKGTEKILKATCKVLRLNSTIDFSLFVKSFSDFTNFEKFSTWYTKVDLESNGNFLSRLSEINTVMNLQVDLGNKDLFIPKAKRKALGSVDVTINDTDYNLIDFLKNYKVDKDNITLEEFNGLSEAINSTLKAYYSEN